MHNYRLATFECVNLMKHKPPIQCSNQLSSFYSLTLSGWVTHTKTMSPTRKSVPRSSRKSDHTKTPNHCKEMQTEVVWTCLPFIRSGHNHLEGTVKGVKRQDKKEVGRKYQGMDRPGVHHVPEGSWEHIKMEETSWKVIYGAPTTPVDKGLVKSESESNSDACIVAGLLVNKY